jgi:hypothetical protein
MIREAKDKEAHVASYKFVANDIPRSTKEPLYKRILEANMHRRLEVKRMSIAITKQTERPFNFYKRDMEAAKSKRPTSANTADLYPPFKASVIPWRVRAPLYQELVERAEYAREQRIKRNAEISLSLSKLPPRMQEHEVKKKIEQETGDLTKERSQSVDRLFSFQPSKAKPVPDFKRLQKEFQ